MLRADHVVCSVQHEGSGHTHAVLNLCRVVAAAGIETKLHVIEHLHYLGPTPYKPRNDDIYQTFLYQNVWSFLERLAISPAMAKGLKQAAKEADIIHSHGLWTMPNVYAGSSIKGTDCRLICAPHGTMGKWPMRNSYWRKRVFWHLWQVRMLKRCHCFHATAEQEVQDIRRLGFSQPIALIPNGVEVPEEVTSRHRSEQCKRLLFLSRIHPKKGVDLLLRAWARLHKQFPDWELVIVGPDIQGFLGKMRRLAVELEAERVDLVGPLYGEKKRQAYLDADLYILPTHDENFGLTIAEALAHGVPVVTTKGAPWQGLEQHDCGWWIDIGEEPLVRCLEEVLSMTRSELDEYGQRGRAWVARDFSWKAIGEMTANTYQWLVGGGQPPGWIDFA